jgi:prepilin-type N-terminal cleavage/methylation domain-containing protein
VRRGITLVELLTVLGILAILAALLFPVLRSARAKGADSADVQRMRQLASAVHLYAAEADDEPPPGMNDASFAEFLRDPSPLPDGTAITKPWATFGDLMALRTRSPEPCQPTARVHAAPPPIPGHASCVYLYDQWSGLRQLKLSAIPGGTTLLYPDDHGRLDARRDKVPCLTHDLGVAMTVLNVCESKTTWWHDEEGS